MSDLKRITIGLRVPIAEIDPANVEAISESLLAILRAVRDQFPDLKVVVSERCIVSGCGFTAEARATARGNLSDRLDEATRWVTGILRDAIAASPGFREVPA